MIRGLLSFKNLLNESSLGLNPHVNLFSRLLSSQISSIIFKLVMPLYKQNISTPIIKVRGYALGPLGLSNSESKTAIIS